MMSRSHSRQWITTGRSRSAREPRWRSNHSCWIGERRVVPVAVEAGLADRDDPRVGCQGRRPAPSRPRPPRRRGWDGCRPRRRPGVRAGRAPATVGRCPPPWCRWPRPGRPRPSRRASQDAGQVLGERRGRARWAWVSIQPGAARSGSSWLARSRREAAVARSSRPARGGIRSPEALRRRGSCDEPGSSLAIRSGSNGVGRSWTAPERRQRRW